MTIQKAEEMYSVIKSAYAPIWPDNKMEKAEAVDAILQEMKKGNAFFSNKDQVIRKCNAAATTHGAKKCKISNLIDSGFWDTTYPVEMQTPEITLRRRNRYQI